MASSLLMDSVPRPHRFVNFVQNDSAKRHILGCVDPGVGATTPKLELGREFCTMHLAIKFRHDMFNRSEVTNKQTDVAKTSTSLRYRMLRRWVKTRRFMAAISWLSLLLQTLTSAR